MDDIGGGREGEPGELSLPSLDYFSLELASLPMSGHAHTHEDAGHSHGHSHDGVACSGHDQEPPSAEELAAHKAEKVAFDKCLKSFYHYEAHTVSPQLEIGSQGSLLIPLSSQSSSNNRRRKDFLCELDLSSLPPSTVSADHVLGRIPILLLRST
jgi:hypothetical protein